ncbi:liprin-beta-1-like isoform X2 [Glandiceps talaboti]
MSSSGVEASDMLAAALEQMDDIIAGTKVEFQNGTAESEKSISSEENVVRVLKLLEDLKESLEEAEEMLHSAATRNQVPESTSTYILKWLSCGDALQTNGHSPTCNHDNYEEKIERLEGDKESLTLQNSVLTEQVEAQTSRLNELQQNVDELQEHIAKTEQMLQQEITTKSKLEMEKLDLMAELSDLKIKLASADKDPEERLKETMNEVADHKIQIREKDDEIEKLRNEIIILRKVKEASAALGKDSEASKLKEAVESLMIANNEKDIRIEELRLSLNRYKKVHEMVIHAQGKKGDSGVADGDQSDTASTISSQPSNIDVEEFYRDAQKGKEDLETTQKTSMPSPTATSTPVGAAVHTIPVSAMVHATPTPQRPTFQDVNSPPSTIVNDDTVVYQGKTSTPTQPGTPSNTTATTTTTTTVITILGEQRTPVAQTAPPTQPLKSSSLEELRDIQVQDTAKPQPYPDYSTLPNSPRKPKEAEPEQVKEETPTTPQTTSQLNGFDMFPRMPDQPKPQQPSTEDNKLNYRGKTGVTFGGKGLLKTKSGGGKRSTSAPNLAETEVAGLEEEQQQANRGVGLQRYGGLSTLDRANDYPTSPKEQKKKKKGIKRFFGKLRRSSSGSWNPDSEPDDEDDYDAFKRGGRLRATAGARLGWSKDFKSNDYIDVPFAKWDSEKVAGWMHEMGLGNYVSGCRNYVKNGSTLIKASPHFFEKELGIKHPLHRKKLQLALRAIASEEPDKMGELDYNWVARWLDDVGLPQYKDSFNEARIDGRMLHYLTVDDLFYLKVTNSFHHVSIKRGIQCLRIQNFHPNCLKRRPTDESWQNGAEVMLWTNHRVMEWLRSVDLSEYAPNLRGSGVHGSLMVLDPHFTAETLASLLLIPPNKTLLRRHLATHFVALVGADCQAKKREAEQNPNIIPLSQLAKMKAKKKSSSMMRKKKSGCEPEDYICPMNIEMPTVPKSQRGPRNPHTNGSIANNYRTEVRSADMVHKQDDEEEGGGGEDNGDAPPPQPPPQEPVNEMDEGAVRQIGAFSEDINKLTNMLAEEEFDDGITSNV